MEASICYSTGQLPGQIKGTKSAFWCMKSLNEIDRLVDLLDRFLGSNSLIRNDHDEHLGMREGKAAYGRRMQC